MNIIIYYLKLLIPVKIFVWISIFRRNKRDEISLLFKFLKNTTSGVMVDVGAQKGSSFLPFISKNWEVHAFEPDNDNFKFLIKYKNFWNLNFKLNKVALSNKKENLKFFTSENSKGIPSLLNFSDNHVFSHKLTTQTLNSYMLENKFKRNNEFLKIDTEGYDYFVLKGLDMKKFRFKIILCEFENKKSKLLKYTTKDMSQYLIKNGYYLIFSVWNPIIEYGNKHSWRCYSLTYEDINENSWGNIFCFDDLNTYKLFKDYLKI